MKKPKTKKPKLGTATQDKVYPDYQEHDLLGVTTSRTLSASHRHLAYAFDAWLDATIKNPEKFEHALTTAFRHLAEQTLGQEPTYGQACVATLLAYLADD